MANNSARRAVGALRQDDRPRARAARRARPTASVAWFRPLDARRARRRCARGDSLEAACYRRSAPARARARRARSSAAIRRSCAASAATTSTRSSTPTAPFNLAKLMVGSEGTLGVVVEAKRQARAAADGEGGAGDPVRRSARGARGDAGDPRAPAVGGRGDGRVHPRPHEAERRRCDRLRQTFVEGDPAALLCVEFYARPRRGPAAAARRARARPAARAASATATIARSTRPRSRPIWSVREAALGLSMAMKGDAQVALVRRGHGRRARAAARLHRRDFLALVRRARHRRPASTRTRRSAACTCGRSST